LLSRHYNNEFRVIGWLINEKHKGHQKRVSQNTAPAALSTLAPNTAISYTE